jgi:hypothetical protein
MTAAMEHLHENTRGAQCISCEGRSFRRSRLKASDLGTLLTLHYPVRCLSCSKRQTVPLGDARRAVSSKVKHARAQANESAVPRKRPSTVGGDSSWSLPVHEPKAMPELHGVTLKHVASSPLNDEKPEQ